MTTPTPLGKFKRDAKQLKRAMGITHFQALDMLAKNRGYKSYHDAKLTLDASVRT